MLQVSPYWTRFHLRRVIVWSAVSTFVLTLIGSTSLADQRYSIGDAVSNDPSETRLIILNDHEAKVEAAIAPNKATP